MINEYRSGDVMVTWDDQTCIHAGECVKGLPQVFDTTRNPWIDPGAADTDALASTIAKCPSGALKLHSGA